MTIKQYVDDVLCVPVTRIGNKFILESIEIVLDTREHKFYQKLSAINNLSPRYLETTMRSAKILGMSYMDPDVRQDIFGKADVATTEYILKAADYYRRTYENKES